MISNAENNKSLVLLEIEQELRRIGNNMLYYHRKKVNGNELQIFEEAFSDINRAILEQIMNGLNGLKDPHEVEKVKTMFVPEDE